MNISRRQFLGAGSASALGTAFGLFGLPESSKAEEIPDLKIEAATETTTICPYCAVGCGMIVSTKNGKLINIEGDPDHPINEGALCSKGMALYQVAVNERRLETVKYRPAGSSEWQEQSWEWALKEIAKRIKATRDATFVTEENGQIVNRTDGIACLGGASLDNEECYLYSKLARAMGITYLEHQARI